MPSSFSHQFVAVLRIECKLLPGSRFNSLTASLSQYSGFANVLPTLASSLLRQNFIPNILKTCIYCKPKNYFKKYFCQTPFQYFIIGFKNSIRVFTINQTIMSGIMWCYCKSSKLSSYGFINIMAMLNK